VHSENFLRAFSCMCQFHSTNHSTNLFIVIVFLPKKHGHRHGTDMDTATNVAIH